ncbi:methyl-accepting chemotaxis protein [Halobaculum marinum]|uniref:Methyl-accepting chemotaxis protein n=1 Tax=Halobaculum marinum TaxID=3031996 RepID=A0ABD5WT94_9EURY|nr:methyl-accepting chemotaxis protein [Halobaculum sp. DT55]
MSYVPDILRATYLRKFAALTLATIVVVAGAGVVLQGQVAAELTHEKHNELETTAVLEANELEGWIEEQRQVTRLLSEAVPYHSEAGELGPYLDTELERFPESTHALHVVDASSNQIEASTTASAEGQVFDHLELTFDGESGVVMSEPYMADGHELLAFASAVPESDRAVVVTVEADAFVENFHSSIEGGETTVVDADSGRIVLASDTDSVLTDFDGDEGALAAGTEGDSGGYDAGDTVAGYAPVEGTDWVVFSQAPAANAYVLKQAVQRDFAILAGLALAGFLLIGLTLGRSTATTLRELSDSADALAAGEVDDSQVVGDDRIDEIGQIRDAFAGVTDYVDLAASQADAVANQEFDAPVLDRDVPGTLGASIAQMRVDLDAAITEMEETTAELQRVAESHGDVMETAADGDLTARMETDTDNDAMRTIAEGFNEMVADLETAMARVTEVAEEVATVSEDAAAGVEETERAAAEVASSTEEITAGTTEQTEQISGLNGEMGDLSAAVEEVAATAEDVAQQSTEAVTIGEEGGALADEAVDEMESIQEATKETATLVRGLSDEVDEIGEIVTLIDGIAEQTNTLALNASIEAARAGAEGDGFAVVANEVKQLATETREATGRIDDLVEQVQASTDDVAEDMSSMRERVDDGTETIESGLGALDDVIAAVERANDGVQSISEATSDQATTAEEVVTMADEVAAVSEETAVEAQTVSAAAEEQTASLSQVTSEVERLSDRATDLRSLTAEFDVDVAGGASARGDSPVTSGADADGPSSAPAATDGGRPAQND